jgi:outer membrane protein
MKLSFITSFFLLALLSSSINAAPGIDVRLSLGQWQADYSGEVGQDTNTATLQELGFDDEDHNVISAEIRHIVPILPNIKLQQTDLDTAANGTITGTLVIDGTTFTATETVDTDLDLSHTDITLFWSPVDNWVTFDFGLTARHFGENVNVVGGTPTRTEAIDLDYWIPLIYLNTEFELPLTGLYLKGGVNAISYDDNSLTDFTAALGYEFSGLAVDFIVELGYRNFELELDDIDGFEGDVEIDGLYLSLGLEF